MCDIYVNNKPKNRFSVNYSIYCFSVCAFFKGTKQPTCSVCSHLKSVSVFPCTPPFIIFDIWLSSLYLTLICKEHIFPIRNPVVTFAFVGWWYFLLQPESHCVSFLSSVPLSPSSLSSSSAWMLDVIGSTEGPVMPCLLKIPPFFSAASHEVFYILHTYLICSHSPLAHLLYTYLCYPHTSL